VRQSIRLIVNTVTLLSRMVVTFGIGLYITRLLLELLGTTGFGLLAALGATGTMLHLLTPSLSTGAIRNMAYELGRADLANSIRVFNATLVIFGVMALVIFGAGLIAAGPLLGALTIPAGREPVAAFVYAVTLVQLCLSTAATPFAGAVEARQAMGQVAAGEIGRSLLNLASVGSILVFEGDPLVVYSTALLIATLLRIATNATIATLRFPEVRVRPSAVSWPEVRRLASFTGWTTLIRVGAPLHAQAAVILIGIAFSPVVTAAYGIAMRLRGYQANFMKVLPRVAQPAMTTREALGDREYMRSLALMTSKYSALGSLFFVVPLAIEAPGILALWLKEVPPDTAVFVRLTLAWMTLQVLAAGIEQGIVAQGAVRGYGLITIGIWAASVALCAYWFFGCGFGPIALPWTYVGATVVHLGVTVGIGSRRIGLPVTRWLREVVWPIAAPFAPAVLAAWAIHRALPDSWLRYLAVGLAYAVVAAPLAWWWSIGPREKRALLRAAALYRLRSAAPRCARGWRRACVPSIWSRWSGTAAALQETSEDRQGPEPWKPCRRPLGTVMK
jgi:O-antigen/teichoic acid export membrane protein